MRWFHWLLGPSLLSVAFMAQAAVVPQHRPLVKFGFYLPTNREASMADIKVSLQVWAEELAGTLGYQIVTNTYQSMPEVRAAVDRDELHFINAGGMELAETFSLGELQRGYASHQQGADDGLALVVRNDSGLTSFSDLRNKRVARLAKDRLAEIYLETQCLKAAKQHCSQFLVLSEEKRDIQSIYGVFFGKTDAALVTLATLHTANELNPQVATRLKVIQEWKVTALVFGMMTRSADPAVIQLMMGAVRDTLKTARGRQMMELFKIDYVEPVEPSILNPYWALLRDYRALDKTYGAQKK